MNKKKSIAVAIVLVLIMLIGGMLAYFTDTDTKTNVFTLGDEVEISLSETWTPEDGLGLHPGAVVTKAPKVVNDSETTPAYVFAEVIVPCYDKSGNGTVDTPLFTLNSIGSGWNLLETKTIDTTNKTITYIYNYGSTSAMTSLAAEGETTAVFSSVTLDSTLTATQAETASATPNIVVNAYGIQIDNLTSSNPATIFTLFN